MQLARQRLTSLKGVGDKQAEKLARLGLHVVQDLLFHLPLRYQDKTRLHAIAQLLPGQEAQIEGEIVSQHLTQSRNSSLLVSVCDPEGQRLTLRFFHFGFRQAQQFKRGARIRAFGEVRSGPKGLEMVHPVYQLFSEDKRPPLDTTLTPVYPSTEGLGQASLLKLIRQAMALLQQYPLPEGLPQAFLSTWQIPPINQALTTLHQPQPDDDLAALKRFAHPAQKRLILEELLTHQLSMQWLRQQEQTRRAPAIGPSRLVNTLVASLPFALTGAQNRVWEAISQDLQRPHPMQRLVQGDVGSGKTIIAAMAAIQAAEAGLQVAVMAPTEILAEQHRNHFAEWLEPLGIELAWLNGRLKAGEKRDQLARIENGDARIVVGTHALFQQEVTFARLGLVIIDEQHRFGVHQRLALHDKGHQKAGEEDTHPHQLIMTATPIPRTLAMSAYGDLDLSVIDELPPGRQPIDTAVLNQSKREEVMAHLVAQCQQGVQAYWVCPLIEESDQLDAQAAEVTAEQFRQQWPDLRLGLIHGRLKGDDKARIMADFQAHALDLLVATTVIEVGVNVPNASLMIIENAERLGLAQLHQLRGRVGRGAKKSHCVLLYKPPLSETGKARLNIMRETNDGFKIAEEDLKLRGPGEILGTRQTGGLQFRIADLERDQAWLNQAREAAVQLLAQAPDQAEVLHQRWLGEKMGYQHA
ncbi:ATP-dependent DNA helicase RecG [Hydrogenovibrio halophilus]|uniref:ATP-dependent DNA helicase RecG n=1 Tax=Hydrogenovibrio halophilus TaxID=373391 RepID=UPI00037032B1|nr:ATP-dependent DNA helicase RecG [Hydrogenovibrio halophilus]